MIGVDGRCERRNRSPENPRTPWHGEVEQHVIGVWRSVQRRDHAVEIVRDCDFSIGRRREHGLTQTADHKGMVIGDEHAKRALFAYGLLPRDPRRAAEDRIADPSVVVTSALAAFGAAHPSPFRDDGKRPSCRNASVIAMVAAIPTFKERSGG